jgi:hypothetical protein
MLYSLSDRDDFPMSLHEIETLSYHNFKIETEFAIDCCLRLDVVIFDPVSKFLFIIENKFGHSFQPEQANAYKTWSEKIVFQDCQVRPVLILIDGQAKVSQADGWLITDYDWIVTSIDSVINRRLVEPDIEHLLRDYCIELSGDYSYDPQLSEYDHHFSLLAEKNPRFISNYSKILKHDQYHDFFGSFRIGGATETLLTLNRYKIIFANLIKYCQFDWLENGLTSLFSGRLECEQRGRHMNFFLKKWLTYADDKNGNWPIYLKLEQEKEGISYLLYLCLWKKNANTFGVNAITDLASKYKIKSRASHTKELLETFTSWDRELIKSVIKSKLEHL